MSDINLIIEDAADALTKNERKLQKRKDNYTPKELKEMLAKQEIQKIQNRDTLNEKLMTLCEKAAREFNLSSIPLGMMEKVALDISIQVKEGNITSVDNVEKNDAIIKTVQREATKAQIVENYEAGITNKKLPHKEIALYIEEIKYIASNPEVAEAIKSLLEVSELDKEIKEECKEITVSNAKEVVNRINQIKQTPKYFEEKRKKAEKTAKIIESGNEDEKRFGCQCIEREVCACNFEQNSKDVQAYVDLCQSFLIDLNSKFAEPSAISAELRKTLLCDSNLSRDDIKKLNDVILNYEMTQKTEELQQYLIENILTRNPNIKKEDILKAVQEATNCELNPERVNKAFLETQARIRIIDNNEFLSFCKFADQIYELGHVSNDIDWNKLEELHKKSPDLYNFTLRAIHMKSKEENLQEISEKTDVLIREVSTERQSEVLMDRISIRNMLEKNGIEQAMVPESFYWTFSAAINRQPENLENLKKQMIEKIKSMEELSNQEKESQIEKIEKIQNREDAIEYSLDGLNDISIRNGETFDRESSREKMNFSLDLNTPQKKAREFKREQRDEKAAIAKILLTPGEYDRYMENIERLRNSKLKDTVQLDFDLLEHLREVDQGLYEWMLSSYTKFANDNRNNDMQKQISKYTLKIKKENAKEKSISSFNKVESDKNNILQTNESIKDVIINVSDENALMNIASSKTKNISTDDELELE